MRLEAPPDSGNAFCFCEEELHRGWEIIPVAALGDDVIDALSTIQELTFYSTESAASEHSCYRFFFNKEVRKHAPNLTDGVNDSKGSDISFEMQKSSSCIELNATHPRPKLSVKRLDVVQYHPRPSLKPSQPSLYLLPPSMPHRTAFHN
ncbi:hypothetical protein D9758_016348 [Tetrapyrgos nigripes]|uniref:Uncharacterized protein n=1 Tax=Tetrapyrgos nigripes TaxID=182062 RepID=A0A8H5BXV8_9AGAR|nr:hypothetical protein D9758_016348 [Tetrapyrgos nigripes]